MGMVHHSCLQWLLLLCIGSSIVILVLNLQSQYKFTDRTKTVIRLLQQHMLNSGLDIYEPTHEGKYEQKLEVPEKHRLDFKWIGYTFNEHGWSKEIKVAAHTYLLHSFSPDVEKQAARKFVDPTNGNVFFANAPAIKWHNGSLVLVCRIWLDKEKYVHHKDIKQPLNKFQDNYLYAQTFDKNLNPTGVGHILGIGLNKEADVGDGALEPRLYRVKNRLFTTFNAAVMFPWGQKLDWTIIYDYDNDVSYVPTIKEGSPAILETKRGVPRDKHWMALIQNDELYFVHNLDPLGVMKCTLEGDCHFVHKEPKTPGFVYTKHSYVGRLRGGTPFEHYSGDYYIGVAHYTSVKAEKHFRYYSTHLVVLCVKQYRIVFVSNDIRFHDNVFANIPQVRGFVIEDGFLFPVSLLVESADAIVIGGHLNDHSAVLLRLRGLEILMKHVIEQDLQELPPRGPPVEFVRRHVRIVLQNSTGIAFLL